MQAALQRALDSGAYARPANVLHYTYRYVENGRTHLLHILGRDRFGEVKSGVWRTLNKRELEADWIVCDCNGQEIVEQSSTAGRNARATTLKQLFLEG